MAGYEVGEAFLSVMPSTRGFAGALGRDLDGPFSEAGRRGGARMGDGVATGGKASFLAAGGGMGLAFAGAFAAVGLVDIASKVTTYLSDAISGASDLAETVNKSSVIFGDSAGTITDWAETAATSVGLSKAAALEAASGFGNMFTQLGFAQETAAAMSTDVVQLSADLGSFNNLPTAEVSDKISAALRGEYDSLQALIPTINAATVEQEALATTGKASAAELTAAEKAAAVLAIVHRDGANAAGDFAETSDGLANSQKILQANLENVQTEIGTALLPIATDLFRLFADEGVPIIQDLAKWFTENEASIRSFAVGAVQAGLTVVDILLLMAATQVEQTRFWLTSFRIITDGFFALVGGILDGAERAFSWVPGIGPKLEAANANFQDLEAGATASLQSMAEDADVMAGGIQVASGFVGELRAKVGELDGSSANVEVTADTSQAEARIAALRNILNTIPQVAITADMRSGGGYYANRATGGPVVAGRPYVVGEVEPELFVPSVGGNILNQSQLAALGVGQGGPRIVQNIYPAPGLSETQIGAASARGIERAMVGRPL